MRVLVDVDGVLADFVSGWLQLLNAEHGRAWTPEDVTSWDVCESLGIAPARRGAAKNLLASCPRFAAGLALYPGAAAGMARLRRCAEVYIVTSPWNSHETWTFDREQWLRKNFGISSSLVIHTSAKHLVAGDVLIDDKTSTCAEWQGAHPRGLAIRWSNPHNRLDCWSGVATSSWDEVIRIVERRERDERAVELALADLGGELTAPSAANNSTRINSRAYEIDLGAFDPTRKR